MSALDRLNEETVRRNNELIDQENNAFNFGKTQRQQSVTPLEDELIAIQDKYKARKNAEMLTPLYKEQQAKSNAQALGNLMLANTKNGKLNAGNFMQQGLSGGIDPSEAFKLMLADKELQNKGTAVTPDAQLKADTDIRVAEIEQKGEDKLFDKDVLKDLREEAKLTREQYDSDTANFIIENRRSLINDPKGRTELDNAIADQAAYNNVGPLDTIARDPLNAINYFPPIMAYNWIKDKRPISSQIQKRILANQLKNK